jgi:hypothetical protein
VLRVTEALKQRVLRNTRTSGEDYLRELLECNNKGRIYDVLRIKQETFYELCHWLKVNAGLRPGQKVLVELQAAMFLWTLNYSASVRTVKERF